MSSHPITITRTIYDPALKNFVFDSPEEKVMPNVRKWIEKENPVIYWYILRVDNPFELLFDQWAVELYTHQALSITDAYIDGIDRRFEMRKRERDPWSDKYVLSIPRQLGIPIVGKGIRRIFFKVDINCREGLMHEYGISGKFVAEGIEAIDIPEKMFRYSCKVGEFRQIFDNNPDEASIYAEKRLLARYSSNSIQVFTNSFRMIHELYKYCHSGDIVKDDLFYKLNSLYSNFEKIPEIADKRINPLLNDGIKVLTILEEGNMSEFKSRYLRLCDSLVEQLHIEVVGTDLKANEASSPAQDLSPKRNTESMKEDSKSDNGQLRCPVCKNLIDSSNRSLLCGKCGAHFCQICESWSREERERGERPLCKKCFSAEQEKLREQMGEEEDKEKENSGTSEAEEIENFTEEAIQHFEKGLAFYKLGRYEEAIIAYEKALEIDHKHIDSWNNKGIALYCLGRYEEALQAYDQSLKIDSKSICAWNNKGITLYDLGRYEEAIIAYDHSLEIDSKSTYAWSNKGNALNKLGRYEEAIKACDTAISIDSKCDDAWNGKGIALKKLGRYEEAIIAYDKAIETGPKYIHAWNNKGIALYCLGRYEEAIITYKKALEINPKYVPAWNRKGNAFNDLGRYEEALQAYEKALEIDPKYVYAWHNKGIALENLGRHEEASACYKRAEELKNK
ncbi:tetratricopeptide repeat protein [Methanosarcina vacuolata]|uniref:TPR domain protein, putative component of TonB system n=1 Tax=Methanosarcina vacuolata Z-761 TaxID=1434123 RepID=A0A0E3Q3K5_9EURY|nr:tetratricopeptide repeat protein [Methanosarcina vacuolata]AKB43939.1 TPR domain protein, putative component of TonB system [Methanosarcina vacuolata Z-761]